MQTKGHGGFVLQRVFNVVHYLGIGTGGARSSETIGCFSVSKGIQAHLIQEIISHIKLQICGGEKTIKVIHNVSSIHDLTKKVPQVSPGYLLRCTFHVVLQDSRRTYQITRRKGVHHIVPLGTELLSLHQHGMELTETKQDTLTAWFQLFILLYTERGKSLLEIGLQT